MRRELEFVGNDDFYHQFSVNHYLINKLNDNPYLSVYLIIIFVIPYKNYQKSHKNVSFK